MALSFGVNKSLKLRVNMRLTERLRFEGFAWAFSVCRCWTMRSLSINRFPLSYLAWAAAFALASCASSMPPSFHYESSVRGERGLEGTFQRQARVTELLDAGVVKNPKDAFEQALPEADISLRKWGLKYFSKDWARYQVMLEADIKRDGVVTKCRQVSTETPVGAPTLKNLIANDGVGLQTELTKLISTCVDQVKDFP